jgi:branched-subunit amino acid aminotransferase/4-amino-4-deoxychorismate lyase
MAEIIYLNGRFAPRSKSKLSPFDRGFLYGYGLFGTMRAYNGHIFRLDHHPARLRCSVQSLGLANRLVAFDLKAACTKTIENS